MVPRRHHLNSMSSSSSTSSSLYSFSPPHPRRHHHQQKALISSFTTSIITPTFTTLSLRRGGGGGGLLHLSSAPFYSSIENNNNNTKRTNRLIICSSSSTYSSSSSKWDGDDDNDDDNEYESYDQVLDVVTFLDPPKELIPFDPSSYNPASYLWKKIEDVPEERRHRLLHLLQPRLITRAWGIAGTKYDDPKLTNKTASALLSDGGDCRSSSFLEFWNCRTSGGPMPLSLINSFNKAIFRSKDGMTCGRLSARSFVGRLAYSSAPLYFTVSQVKEVMSTEHPCDFAYHFGDGLSDIHDYPSGFPKPAKHPWPFNDQVVIYVRHLGPGVLVGQAWQEGEDLEKLPQKLCGEILMVKDYYATSVDKQ